MGANEDLVRAAQILEGYEDLLKMAISRGDKNSKKLMEYWLQAYITACLLREFALMDLYSLPREDRVQPKLTLEQEIALALYRDGQTRDIEWENVPGYLHGTLFSKARAIVTSLREIGLLLETEQRDAIKAVLNAADNYIDYGIGDDLHALTDNQRVVVRKLVGTRWER